MKVIQIDKEKWADGLDRLAGPYRLFAPVKEDEFHNFKELAKGEAPDLSCLNTRLSPKSIIYPQSEALLEYSLDESREDHHIMKEVNTDYSPRAIIGIRPCDAKAFMLVGHNFDTPEYKDPIGLEHVKPPPWWVWRVIHPAAAAFAPRPAAGRFMRKGLMSCW